MSSKRVAPRQRIAGERGETLIEFAFASIIFFTLIFGVVQFGIAIWNYNLISDLAQEGARWAAVRGPGAGMTTTTTDVQNYVNSRALNLTVTVTTPLGAPSAISQGNPVEVTVTHALSAGGGILPSWTFNVASTGRMIMTR